MSNFSLFYLCRFSKNAAVSGADAILLKAYDYNPESLSETVAE